MIIFSASLPGLRSYLTERFFAYGLFSKIEMALSRMRFDISEYSAPAHTAKRAADFAVW